MRLRQFILFSLFGLLGALLLGGCLEPIEMGYLSEPQSAELRKPSSSLEEASKPRPPLPEILSAEEAITNALSRLPEGEIYHNVPEDMKVGITDTIEAGIAPQVTERLQEEIQGRGDIDIVPGVRFDPSGMEMKVVTQVDEFDVFEERGGEQFVTAGTPGRWIWHITPLKAGNNLIVVKAIVKLNVPELNTTRPVEVEVFRVTRQVQVNPVYSASQFIATNWKEVLGLIIGSGSVASGITLWISRRREQEIEEASAKQKERQKDFEFEELREFEDRLKRWRTSEISDEQLKLFVEAMQMEKVKLFRYISEQEIDVRKDALRELMEKGILSTGSE